VAHYPPRVMRLARQPARDAAARRRPALVRRCGRTTLGAVMILACFALFAMQGWARWEAT
jgi:hypothetical protein